MGKLPTYELTVTGYNNDMGAISFVDEPANESNYLAFDSKSIKLSAIEEDKQEVIGVVLIPKQLLFRRDASGYEYQVFMRKETIAELSRQYLQNMWGNAETTLQHELPVSDTTLLESWLTGETDKAAELGFEVPVGTWMVHFKVNSDTVWKEIKAGMANGFSIEAWMDLVPTSLSKQEPTDEDISDEELINEIEKLIK